MKVQMKKEEAEKLASTLRKEGWTTLLFRSHIKGAVELQTTCYGELFEAAVKKSGAHMPSWA